jgi:hypothetical protein
MIRKAQGLLEKAKDTDAMDLVRQQFDPSVEKLQASLSDLPVSSASSGAQAPVLRALEIIVLVAAGMFWGRRSAGSPVRRAGPVPDASHLQSLTSLFDQVAVLEQGLRNLSDEMTRDLHVPLRAVRDRLHQTCLVRPDGEQAYAEISAAITDLDRLIGAAMRF